jgi:hypothetical protein
MTEKKDTRFKKGQSGNPAGRTPGSGFIGEVRRQLQEDWLTIRPVLIQRAQEGDMGAIRIVAERVCPPIKASEVATPLELPAGSLTDRANAVIAALADGELNTTQAAQMLQALGALAKVIETDELQKRIEALEERSNARP